MAVPENRTKVWRFPLRRHDFRQQILMPPGAVILCSREQQNEIALFALIREQQVDFAKPAQVAATLRTFLLYDTGQPLDLKLGNHTYWGTVLLDGGSYSLHIFELNPPDTGKPIVRTNVVTEQFAM